MTRLGSEVLPLELLEVEAAGPASAALLLHLLEVTAAWPGSAALPPHTP